MGRCVHGGATRFDGIPFDAIRLICAHLEMKDVVTLYLVMKRGTSLRAVKRPQRFITFLQGDPPNPAIKAVRQS